MLQKQGLGPAADILTAPIPKAVEGSDLIAGLEGMTRTKTGAPPSFSDEPVSLSLDKMTREARNAVRSQTGAKLGSAPGVVKEGGKGLVPLDVMTKGSIKAEGYVPKTLSRAITPRFTAPSDITDSALLGTLDTANHVYAQSRLNLNPATITGRLFGHTSLAAIGAPHPLGSLWNAIKTFTGKISPESQQILDEAPARLNKGDAISTFKSNLAEDVQGKANLPSRIASKVDAIANKSPITRWAAKMDDSLRKGIYLAERRGGAGAEDALRTVNRVAGEFDALSPNEQAIWRRISPFYNWHKQIALIAEHLAEDHPARAVLLAKIGSQDQAIGQKEGTPGEVNFGGHAISPGFLVPFGEAGTTFKAGGMPLAGPVPKAAFGALTGINPNTAKPFTGPDRTGKTSYKTPGVIQNLRKSFPQVNVLDAITGRDQVVRYNDGSPVLKNKQPISTNSNWVDTLSTLFGLRAENTQQAKNRTAAIAASNAKTSGGGKGSSSKKSKKWGG